MTTPVRGCPVHTDFDPLDAAFLRDPYAVMAGLPLASAPVFHAPSLDYYVVTRYADVERVFLDPETFSAANARLPLIALAPEVGKTLLDGGHIPGAVDEVLRFDPSVPVWRARDDAARVTRRRGPSSGRQALPLARGRRPRRRRLPRPRHLRPGARQRPPEAGLRPRPPLLHRLRMSCRSPTARRKVRRLNAPRPCPAGDLRLATTA
jgi:hypothetical protein